MALAAPFPAPEQFVLSVAEQVTEGDDGLLPTIDSQLAVQPVVKSVTTTVYVPADKPLMLASVEPLLHE